MTLIELPDAKFVHLQQTDEPDKYFTIGKDYPIMREIGNGVVVQANNGDDMIVLKSRFK